MLATINTPKVQAPFGVSLLHLVLIIQGYKQNYMKYIYNLNTISIGYKIDDKNYLALNFLITVLVFSIYKSYYISEQKTKYIDVYRIFANVITDNSLL
jgi:hypothetical protein